METLILIKDFAVIALLLYIITHLLRFENVWRDDRATAAKLIKLNQKRSKTAFLAVLAATILSSVATYFLGTGNYNVMTVFFDLSLVFWAVFFKIMSSTVTNSEEKWPAFLS